MGEGGRGSSASVALSASFFQAFRKGVSLKKSDTRKARKIIAQKHAEVSIDDVAEGKLWSVIGIVVALTIYHCILGFIIGACSVAFRLFHRLIWHLWYEEAGVWWHDNYGLAMLKKNFLEKIFGYEARCEFWVKIGLRFWILVGYVDFLTKFGAKLRFRV